MTAPAAYADPAPAPADDARAVRGSPTGWLALGLGAVGAVLAGGRALSYHLPPCALLEGTGVPCPACGLTRLGALLVQGEVGAAVAGDLPGALLLVLLAVIAAAQLRAVAGRPVPALRSPVLPLLLAGLVLGHWAVTLATGGLLS